MNRSAPPVEASDSHQQRRRATGFSPPSLKGDRAGDAVQSTGKFFDESELGRSGSIAIELGLLILLDNPCRHFTYEVGNRNMGTVAGAKLGPSNDSLFRIE